MSCRCEIVFMVEGCEEKQIPVRIFRRESGNPEYVIPQLKEFIEWNKDLTEIDPGPIAANFIYWAKMKAEKGVKDSEENFGKFVGQVVKGDVKQTIPVGNYTIHNPKIKYLMPLEYLYTVNYFLKTPEQFEDAPPFEQKIMAVVDKIRITVGEPVYKKDIVEDRDSMPLLEMEDAKAIDTIEIKREEGEKNE